MSQHHKSAPSTDLDIRTTQRGFVIGEFLDANNVECSIQESSAAQDEGLIWLGCSYVGLKELVPGRGWQHLDLGAREVTANTRMHLSQSNVRALLPALQHFAEHGTIPDAEG